jgi:tetratricopeptide (TPR) repeat protein
VIQALYDAGRFVDAYAGGGAALIAEARADELDPRGLVLAARLAQRLGSSALCHALLRRADRRAPDDLWVRYFAQRIRVRSTYLDVVRSAEGEPPDPTYPAELHASWWASLAGTYGELRDFERAHACLDRARAVGVDRAWVDIMTISVLLHEDRAAEAATLAEATWASAPGNPGAASSLADALGRVGRMREAAEQLVAHTSAHPQSIEVRLTALHALASSVERDGAGADATATLHALAHGLEDLAPLADRAQREAHGIARTRVAEVVQDREAFRSHVRALRSPFFRAVSKNLEANPCGERVLVAHRFERQRHDTCLPASVASALGAFGVDVDQDALAAQVTFAGTPFWRVIAWAEARGYVARPFVLTPDIAATLLGRGLPFVFSFQSLSQAHAVVALGRDLGKGTLLYHDPSHSSLGEVLLAGLLAIEAPIGPTALLLLPPDHAHRAADLALPDERGVAAVHALERARVLGLGRTALEAGADVGLAPDDPHALHLATELALARGHHADAARAARAAFERYPRCVVLQRLVLRTASAERNTALLRATLERIVDTRPLPGAEAAQARIPTEPSVLTHYAEVLFQAGAPDAQIERVLRRALRAAPTAPEGYAISAMLEQRRGRRSEAMLPLRIAATLEPTRDRAAWAYAAALYAEGDVEGSVRWLERRVESLPQVEGRHDARRTLVEWLEELGRPEAALAVIDEGLRLAPDDPWMAALACACWVRHGRLDDARAALARVEARGSVALIAEAAIPLLRVTEGAAAAVARAEAWIREAPDDPAARATWLSLVEATEGPEAALAHAERWLAESPNHEDREVTVLELLARAGHQARRAAMTEARLARNPDDAWGWRELAALALDAVQTEQGDARAAAEAKLEHALARAEATAPGHQFTRGLVAARASLRGERERAVAALTAVLDDEPDSEPSLWQLARLATIEPRFADVARARIDRAFTERRGHFRAARAALHARAAIDGWPAATALAERWAEEASDDPSTVEAWIDCVLEGDGARSKIEEVLPAVERAAQRFPLHVGLAQSLAHAYALLGRDDDAIATLERILTKDPARTSVRRMLAQTLATRGRLDAAIDHLAAGVALTPHDVDLVRAHASTLLEAGRTDEAREALARARRRLPLAPALLADAALLSLRAEGTAAARALLDAAIDAHPDHAPHRTCRARFAVAVGVPRATALADVAAALRLAPDDLDGVLDAADLYVELGEPGAARVALTEARSRAHDTFAIDVKALELDRNGPRRAEAPRALAALLAARPGALQAWELLLDWLAEDEAWPLARDTLPAMRPPSREAAGVHARRLELLARAGVSSDTLEPEWAALTREFPSEQQLVCRRADAMLQRGEVEAARAMLEQLLELVPTSGPAIARLARLLVRESRVEAALARTTRLFSQRTTGAAHAPTLRIAFDALVAARAAPALTAHALRAIGELTEPSKSALDVLITTLTEAGALVELERILTRLEAPNAPWRDDGLLAAAVSAVARVRASEAPFDEACDRAPERWQTSDPLWAARGASLVRAGRLTQAARWLADWDTRATPGSWAVACLVEAERLRGLHERARTIGERALEQLPPDDDTGQLTVELAHVYAALDAEDALAQVVDRTVGAPLAVDDDRSALSALRALVDVRDAREAWRLRKAPAAVLARGTLAQAWRRWVRRRLSWFWRLLLDLGF